MKPLLLLLGLVVSSQLMAQGVELKNIKEINTKELDFSPVPFGNGIIFTSSKSNRFLKCPSNNAGDYTDLKYAEKITDSTFQKPVSLSGSVNGKYNDGSSTFNPAGNKMIFSRNNTSGKNDQNVIDLKLYSADLVGDRWENVEALPFNSDDFSTCHPTLSHDGTLLIFASNRPGSNNGSMDLYSAKLENGVWSIPESLGAALNSTGNELFPFLDEQGILFFSSDGHGGAGGLDIFAASQNTSGQWEMIGNLGDPWNQGSDDVNFVSLNGGTSGYLASDRGHKDAQGMDDIYHWKYAPEDEEATILVVDKETNEKLYEASVEMTPTEYGNMLDKIYGGGLTAAKTAPMKTDRQGAVKVQVRKGTKYSIVSSKTDYKTDMREVSAAEITAKPEYIIPLVKEKYYAKLIVQVVEDPGGKPIPLADIKILDKTTGKVISLTGDGEGMTNTQIDCDHVYEITASKRPYYDNTVTLADYKIDCKDGEVKVVVRLKSPLIVILEPIFYDFDRYYIRKRDAQPSLDSLITIMNRYPSLQVRLGGHTDARGTNQYNDKLATNRANSAKNYLTSKGIAAERIVTEEFGELNPVNNCTDEVFCEEKDHQLNRRVDVTAERHQEGGVDFRTRPVTEMKVVSDRK
ncbi:MAG: OmpA family protein [Bacteroidetes bacterium]|nr:OmpA family protein [Bacteroidota bacterium]